MFKGQPARPGHCVAIVTKSQSRKCSICLRCEGSGQSIDFFKLFKSFEESAPIARQIVTNSKTSDSPLTALVFGDEGLRSTKALGELMLRQVSSLLRALIINSQKTACSVEWTDLSSLGARVAIGAEDDRTLMAGKHGLVPTGYVNSVPYCLCFSGLPAQEANCRDGQFSAPMATRAPKLDKSVHSTEQAVFCELMIKARRLLT